MVGKDQQFIIYGRKGEDVFVMVAPTNSIIVQER